MKFTKYLNNKKIIISIISCLLGALIGIYSASIKTDVLWKMISTVSNSSFILFYLIGIIIFIDELYKKNHSSNILLRQYNLSSYIKDIIKNIIKINVLLFVITIFSVIIGSLIVTKGNFEIYNYIYYNIPIWLFVFLYYLRVFIIFIFLSIIFYLIRLNFHPTISGMFIVSIISSLYFPVLFSGIITDIFEAPIITSRYFEIVPFSNFSLEITATIMQFAFLLSVIYILYYYKVEKNQEDKLKWNIRY